METALPVKKKRHKCVLQATHLNGPERGGLGVASVLLVVFAVFFVKVIIITVCNEWGKYFPNRALPPDVHFLLPVYRNLRAYF